MAPAPTSEPAAFVPREHPHRALINDEIHARPVTPLGVPLRVRRAAFMADDGRRHFADLRPALIQRFGLGGGSDARQLGYAVRDLTVTVELHNEFATLTWTSAADDWTTWPEGIGLDLFADMPLMVATRIDLMAGDAISAAALAGFKPASFCYSEVFAGRAQVATDFVVDKDGFTRFEIAAGRCGSLTRGVIVRRLLELETYRSLALLALPLARSIAARTQDQEQRLAVLMGQLGESVTIEDNRQALDSLHALSIEVGRTVEETSYRFAASRAYADVFRARIVRLEEMPIAESTTIARYLENRLDPALATGAAIEKRLLALTDKLERSTGLLNARISLSIESQNQAVLDTILLTARSQYRLQETVEGLSILAISYYALSLLSYILEGFAADLPLGKPVMLALAAPIIVALVWYGLRRLRRSPRSSPGE